MINALIELSAKNRFVVFLLVAVAVVAADVVDEDAPARRHSGS